MKTLLSKNFAAIIVAAVFITTAHAQNIFPSTGRTGIYTTSPITSLQVKGGARIGTTVNYVNIDSATGQLSFAGTGAYQVAGNKYAFQFTGNPNYGLFFNSTNVQYEFRNGTAVPVFSINANTGNSVFNGTLKVGAYTLPSTDGTNGQVLKTNGSGALTWSADNGTAYTAGTGISISGNIITNTTPDQTVILNNGSGISVTGTYPNFTIAATGSGANLNLSNLSAPTAVNVDLVPNANSAYDVGSASLAWRKLYVGGEMYMNGLRTIYSDINNVYVGPQAGQSEVAGIGTNNSGVGYHALYSSFNASNNTASGANSLSSNVNGNTNTATGSATLFSNTSGSGNTANGNKALYLNTTGYSNVAVGTNALYNNTNQSNLVAVGDSALYNNGLGSGNDFSWNTAVGSKSLFANTIGTANTGLGYNTLDSNTTGVYNTATGAYALRVDKTGFGNTGLGSYTDVSGGAFYEATAIGFNAIVDASYKVRVGDANVTSIGGQVGWTTFSDGRYKKNVKEDVKGLAFINSLKPITYTVDLNGLNSYYDKNRKHDDEYEKVKKDMQPSTDKASEIIYNGFIAQDVEAAAKKLNYNFSGIDKPQTKDGLYGLRYSDFVVPLVKAVQELSKINDAKDAKIDTLQIQNADLQKQFNDLKTLVLSIQQQQQSCSPCNAAVNSTNAIQSYAVIKDNASLQQNIPNPFTNNTTIGYSLPQKISAAQIIITDKSGKTLKAITISGSGKGIVNVDASTLSSGAYQYSLIIDGKLIDTKQMILAK